MSLIWAVAIVGFVAVGRYGTRSSSLAADMM